jgi:hypothetical protein
MKKILLFLFFIPLLTVAQRGKLVEKDVDLSNLYLGIVINNDSVRAKKISFNNRIYNYHVNSVNGLITFQLRKLSKNEKYFKSKGLALSFSVEEDSVLWRNKINYNFESYFFSRSMFFQYNSTKKTTTLFDEKGNRLWSLKKYFYHIFDNDAIALTYNKKFNNNNLEGVDLGNSEIIWSRKIDGDKNQWRKIIEVNNDTTVLIISDGGIFSLNKYDGNGWEYSTSTINKDYSTLVASNIVGIGLGLLTGTFVSTYGDGDIIFGIYSNLEEDSLGYYFSSKESISYINKSDGLIKWKYDFSKKSISKSNIFIRNDSLWLLNRGYAYMGRNRIEYGKPFLSCFDKNTGKQYFHIELSSSGDQIIDANFTSSLNLFYNNRIERFSFIENKIIDTILIDTDKYGFLNQKLSEFIYFQDTDSTFMNIVLSDTSLFNFSSESKFIIQLDKNFEVVNKISEDELFFLNGNYKQFKFITDNKKIIVVNGIDKIVAVLDGLNHFRIVGDYMYAVKENELFIIDIRTFDD